MPRKKFRKDLGTPELLSSIRKASSKIRDPKRGTEIPLVDCLMSGLAVFHLKQASLLKFEESRQSKQIQANLQNLYDVTRIPSDTQLRTRLDVLNPAELQSCFVDVHRSLQRGNVLKPFTYLDGHLLLSMDGTEFFSSRKIHCDYCCEKFGQMVSGLIITRC